MVRIGTVAMRCQSCTLPLMAFVSISNMLFQTTGKTLRATLLAVARQGLTFIPCVLLLPRLIQPALWGVYLSQPMADVMAFVMGLPMILRFLPRLPRAMVEKDVLP